MDNEKLLFKCTMTRSLKDINEGSKIISKKKFFIIKTILSLLLILFAIYIIWNSMHKQNLSLNDAVNYFLSSKIIIVIYIFIAIYIWKLVEIKNWIRTKTGRINIKDFGKSNSCINFYEMFFEAPIFSKPSSQVKVYYSDITNFYITKNIYVFCIYKSNLLIYNNYIRKDSFIEGNEQDFVKFIQSKINISNGKSSNQNELNVDNEKLLFKYTSTYSLKDLYKAFKCISKTNVLIHKIKISLAPIAFAVGYIHIIMQNENLFLIDAIKYFFSYKIIAIIYIIIIIYVWKSVEIRNWITIKKERIKIKDIEKSAPKVYFYETFYEYQFYSNFSSIVRVNYSDVTNFYIAKNLYILCIFEDKDLVNYIVIRKDSCIEGNEQEFVKFIQSKISIQ